MSKLFSTVGLLVLSGFAFQSLIGQSVFGANQYAEYIPGDLPIILVAPHGGEMKPDEIADRNCTGCSYSNDLNTQELGRVVLKAIETIFGCKPHLIINRLHRSKMDANRAIGEAADGDPIAEQAWKDFHGFIAQAKAKVDSTYGRGLLIDLHGHGHSIQRLELGYLLSKSDLHLENEELDNNTALRQKFSLRSLLESGDNLSLSKVLRGPKSLGTLFEEKGFPAVPSTNDPRPESEEPYFTGGYTTQVYGSSGSGTIDAVQIECNYQGVRENEFTRANFAEALAELLKDFFATYYPSIAETTFACGEVTGIGQQNILHQELRIFPNPGGSRLNIWSTSSEFHWKSIRVFDLNGKEIPLSLGQQSGEWPVQLSFPEVVPGLYYIRMTDGQSVHVLPYILQN